MVGIEIYDNNSNIIYSSSDTLYSIIKIFEVEKDKTYSFQIENIGFTKFKTVHIPKENIPDSQKTYDISVSTYVSGNKINIDITGTCIPFIIILLGC